MVAPRQTCRGILTQTGVLSKARMGVPIAIRRLDNRYSAGLTGHWHRRLNRGNCQLVPKPQMAKNRPQRRLCLGQKPAQPSAAVTAKLQQAVAHHRCGQLAQAERLYREILEQVPTHFDALHFVGGLQYQKGQYGAAVDLFQRAIRISPGQAAAYSNLGLALQKLKKFDQALASYERALSIKPDFVEAQQSLEALLRVNTGTKAH